MPVRVVEVGPRDGLQNEPMPVSTEVKVGFIARLVAAGHTRIEATSFVSPRAIPQLADSTEVARRLPRAEGVRYTALVPNRRGLDAFLAARDAGSPLHEIAVFTGATDRFVLANIGVTISESIAAFRDIVARATTEGLGVRGYVSTVFGCPYEGRVAPERGLAVARTLLEMGCAEVSVADTLGVATPADVERFLDLWQAASDLAMDRLALHFHDTRGTALPNVLTALRRGVTTFDASAGGLGGCPYAPGAAGNLASEDLVYMLEGMGFSTGIDLGRLVDASSHMAVALGRKMPSRTWQAEVARRGAGMADA